MKETEPYFWKGTPHVQDETCWMVSGRLDIAAETAVPEEPGNRNDPALNTEKA